MNFKPPGLTRESRGALSLEVRCYYTNFRPELWFPFMCDFQCDLTWESGDSIVILPSTYCYQGRKRHTVFLYQHACLMRGDRKSMFAIFETYYFARLFIKIHLTSIDNHYGFTQPEMTKQWRDAIDSQHHLLTKNLVPKRNEGVPLVVEQKKPQRSFHCGL